MSFALRLSALFLFPFSAGLIVSAQTNVLTQHNDIGRTGQNITETVLTPANVSSGDFGLVGSLPIDGAAFAQPLYLSSLNIGGVNHSVVFVATEHDSVYAFDAGANGQVLWKASLFDAAHGAIAATPGVVANCINSNSPEFGAMSTPVIDPATNTMYVVGKTSENNSQVYRIHALDVTTGAEKFGGPTVIQATVAGTGAANVNGQVAFDPSGHMQRPGLLLLNGTVYIGFGSMCDVGSFHGWVMGYNASTLAQTSAFLTTPNGAGSGVWLSGAGLAADNLNGVGRTFVPLGNGNYDATVPYGTNTMDYGDDILTLNLSKGIQVTDAFTPNNQAILQSGDIDVGAGGLVVLPDNMPGASVPHEAVHMGKSGQLVVLNRDNLGGYNTTTDQVLQEFNPTLGNLSWNQTAGGLWGMPAYWNGNLYLWPAHDAGYDLQQFKFTNGLLATTPYSSATPTDSILQGASPSVSASGTTNGIVWVTDTGNSLGGSTQVFYALDATNVANTLWSSATNAADSAGIEQHFVFPTIADGRVFLSSTLNNGAAGNLLVYGLLDFAMNVPTALSINPGNHNIATIALTAPNNFTQNISFSASGLPVGVTVSFAQQANGSVGALFTASATAAAGIANVTITATRGPNKQTATMALTVGGASDFLLSATPVTALVGSTGSSRVTVTPQNGFTGAPAYSVVSAPAGATVTLSGCSATGCTLLATASGTLSLGSYPITLSAARGSVSHLVTTSLIVSRTGYVNVDLSKLYNTYALATDGTAPQGRGIDGNGYALSNTLFTGSITSNGTTFRLGPPDVLDAVAYGGTVTLPAGNYASVQILTSGGTTGTFPVVVTYTDGSSTAGYGYSSDWGSSFTYGTEFVAASPAYRVTPGGYTQNGPWYVNGNAVALNPNKTVASLTLPNNGVVVLAAALSYSNAAPQSILFNSIVAQQAGTSLALNATATSGLPVAFVSSTPSFCTVSGTTVSSIAAGTCTIVASQPGNSTYAAAASISQTFTVTPLYQATVNLSSLYNVNALAKVGAAAANGGFDGAGYAFPTNLIGTSVSWAGTQFSLGAAGGAAAVSSIKVSLPSASFSSLQVLASGAFGSQTNQPFVLTYSDGSTTTLTQSVSDWGQASGYPGESIAISAAYRVQPDGTAQNGPWMVFGYSFPVNPAKTLTSVTLPNSRNVIVLAMTLSSNTPIAQSKLLSSYQAAANLSASFNVNALTNQGVPAGNGGFDAPGSGFAANLLPSPTSWGGSSFTFGNPGVADAVSSTNVALPSGSFSSLQMLASSAIAQTSQPFLLTYTDGTTATLTQSFSGWSSPAANPGEAAPISTAYRVAPDSSQQPGPWYVFGYSLPVDSTKTPSSLTLPGNRNLSVFALTLSSAAPFVQTISFGSLASQQVGSSSALTATASSGLAVTLTSATPGTCTVSGTTATTLASGTCTVTASQGGNNVYPAATPVSQSFSVTGKPQTVTFATISTQAVNSTVALSATASSSLPVTFASVTPAVCTVSGTTASLAGGGTCTIAASQAGNSTYAAASATQSFTVTLLSQTVSFSTIPTNRAGATASLTATASSSLPVTYASSTTSICTVASSTATLLAAGTCTLVATQAGSTVYAAANVSQSFTVAPPPVVVPLSSVYNVYALFNNGTSPTNGGFDNSNYAFPANLLGTSAKWNGAPFTLAAAGGANAVSNVKVTVPTGTFTGLQVLASAAYGQQASQAFVLTYTDGTTTTVKQSLSDWGSSNGLAGESIALSSAYRVTPNGTSQNGPWMVYGYSFAVDSTKTLASVTLPSNRNVIVFAMTLMPSPIAQTVSFGTLGAQVVGTPLTLAATASSGLAVSYASSTTSVCTVNGTTATFVAAGTCTLTASQAGNSSYSAATAVTQSVTVTSH